MSRFSQYQTFIAILDSGSLSGAARALNISPSAVSKQIGLLEQQLGSQLLLRDNRRVSATVEGAAFYEAAKDILARVAEAEDSMHRNRSEISGLIRISCSKSLARSPLFDHLAAFRAEHPLIRFDIRMTDRIESLDGLDFAFRLGALGDSSRHFAKRLAQSRLVCCASPAYIARHGKPETLGQLNDHPLMILMPDNLSDQLRRFLRDEQIILDRQRHHGCDDVETVYQSVRAGLAPGLMLSLTIEQELREGLFIDLLPNENLPVKDLSLVSKDLSLAPRKHRLFRDFMIAAFQTAA